MSLDLTLVGNKIRRYREQLDLSVQDLSDGTGISSEHIFLYEKGKREPTGDEILILADFFRCDYKFFISNEKLAPFEETEQLYRRYGSDFSKPDRRCVQDFLFLCEIEEFLTTRLGRDEGRNQFEFRKSGTFYKAHGEQAAAALRRHLQYGPTQVEMNIYGDMRRIGVHVFRRKLGNSDISGLYIRHPVAGKCVLVNYSEDVYRQRFTAGHELAHTILDDEQDFVVSFAKWDRTDLTEIRANTFSSRYLMPPELLRSVSTEQWTVDKGVDWAQRLKVSTEALAYALREAGLIQPEFVDELRGVRVPADSKVDPELPGDLSDLSRRRKQELLERGLSDHYVDLCFDAYGEGVISSGKLAECFISDNAGLEEIAEIYGRSLIYGD